MKQPVSGTKTVSDAGQKGVLFPSEIGAIKTKTNTMTYSSSLAVNRQRAFASRNQNSTSFKAKEQAIGPVSNTVMLIVLACLLGLLYLTQVTKTNAFSYRINDLKEQQTNLQAEHDQLVIDSARLQSLERVKNSEASQKLVQASPSATISN